MTARATQGAGYVGRQATADSRVTQAAGYVGILSAADGIRATQGAGYVGRFGVLETRVTQAAGYVGCLPLKPPCLTTEAQCWRIERTDGVVYRFTAHDRRLTFRGEEYTPCGSLSSSALQTSSEFGQTENMDLSGFISAGQFRTEDLFGGRFDGARVEVWRVDWSDTTKAEILAAGTCGSVQFGASQFRFEVTTATDRLQQRPILQPVMASCRFKLGDARCTVDLAALTVTGTVDEVTAIDLRTGARRRIFADTSRTEVADYFQLGRLTWTTGANAGLASDVKSFDGTTFVLESPMQNAIEIGDTYTVYPGCDRILTTCDTKFSNAENFGGFPHVKGSDDLTQTPKAKT